MTTSYRSLACALIASAALSGCANLSPSSLSLPSIPPPSFDWLTGGPNKPGPLPVPKGGAAASIVWQASVGKAGSGFAPAITTDAVYAAASDGSLTRIDPASGHVVWRVNAGHPLSAGPGADAQIIVVGTDQGLVLAFDAQGKALWTAQVSSTVTAPPLVSDKVVTVFSGDGRIYGLATADGKTLWVDPRTLPSLTVRNAAGGVMSRGGVFVGTAGGQLLAIAAQTGALGWDATVAVPKGSTELERIADVTSRPFVDENEACAAAFQGRVACFDVVRGTLLWTRDIASLAGITGDAKRLYIVDDSGNVQALDRSNGASIWKQDVLAKRHIGGPQIIGDDIGVVDVEGYLHLLSRSDGTYLARLATDGTAATAQPSQYGGGILWQSKGGNVYSVSAR